MVYRKIFLAIIVFLFVLLVSCSSVTVEEKSSMLVEDSEVIYDSGEQQQNDSDVGKSSVISYYLWCTENCKRGIDFLSQEYAYVESEKFPYVFSGWIRNNNPKGCDMSCDISNGKIYAASGQSTTSFTLTLGVEEFVKIHTQNVSGLVLVCKELRTAGCAQNVQQVFTTYEPVGKTKLELAGLLVPGNETFTNSSCYVEQYRFYIRTKVTNLNKIRNFELFSGGNTQFFIDDNLEKDHGCVNDFLRPGEATWCETIGPVVKGESRVILRRINDRGQKLRDLLEIECG